MDLINYIGLKIYVTISNGYYYTGVVIAADSESITLIDKKGLRVSLKKEVIETVTEIHK